MERRERKKRKEKKGEEGKREGRGKREEDWKGNKTNGKEKKKAKKRGRTGSRTEAGTARRGGGREDRYSFYFFLELFEKLFSFILQPLLYSLPHSPFVYLPSAFLPSSPLGNSSSFGHRTSP